MYNGRALLGPLRVLIYSGRVPSGPRLDWSGPTPRLGFTKILQSGRGVGGTLNTRAGCGRYLLETLAVKHSSGLWEVPSRDSSSGSNKDTTIGAGCGRYLKHSSGLWEVPSRDSSS